MAGDSAAELFVDVSARETVSAVLARLETQLTSTNSSVEKIATAMGARLGSAQQRAASDALSHAQAQARLQAASGNLAGGIRTLQSALQDIPAGTTAAIRGETQLVQLQTRLAKETQGTSAFVDAFKQGLFGLVAPAAAAGVALSVLKNTAQSFVDAFKFKAQLDATTASIKSQLDGFRDAGTTYDEAAAFGRKFNITQEETSKILQSSVGSLRSSTASVAQLETALIRLQSKDPSKPISEAARALAELESGDVTSIKELFRVSAKDALAMRDAIVAGGDSVQVLTAYLDRSQTGMDALALRAKGVQGAFNELQVAQEDMTLAQAQFAQGPGLVILEGKINVVRGATRVLSGDFDAMGQSIHVAIVGNIDDAQRLNEEMSRLQNLPPPPPPAPGEDPAIAAKAAVDASVAAQAAQDAYTRSILEGGTQAEATAAREAVLAAARGQGAAVTQVATDIEQQRIDTLNAAVALSQQAAQASLVYADSMAMTGIQARAASEATQIKANADQVASVDAQTHALAQQQLAETAQAAAQALLANGQAGANTAALLAGSSSQVDVLTAAYYRLAAAQAAANAGKVNAAALVDQRAGERGPGSSGVAEAAAQEQARLNAIYKRLVVPEPKKAKGSGGGTKLSDQTKLNNSLLDNQAQYESKAEDAAAAHEKRLLDIQAEYAKKSLAQQKANEISKRQSQADFYDRLTSSDLNKSKNKGDQAALKQIDADYQAAYAKAQQIAQSGNAKLAADYLAFKQKQAESELSYAEAVAKAKADKDTAEVNRLAQIQKLRQAAAAEEEKQLLEGGDANTNARDQAIAEESAKYAESQDKIGVASDRAAERKIANAERSGKAIDAEQLKLDTLASTYDRIAPARSSTGVAPPLGSTPADAAATDTPAAAGQKEDPIVSALNAAKSAIVDAIGRAEQATKGAGDKVASAVKSLPRSVT